MRWPYHKGVHAIEVPSCPVPTIAEVHCYKKFKKQLLEFNAHHPKWGQVEIRPMVNTCTAI